MSSALRSCALIVRIPTDFQQIFLCQCQRFQRKKVPNVIFPVNFRLNCVVFLRKLLCEKHTEKNIIIHVYNIFVLRGYCNGKFLYIKMLLISKQISLQPPCCLRRMWPIITVFTPFHEISDDRSI